MSFNILQVEIRKIFDYCNLVLSRYFESYGKILKYRMYCRSFRNAYNIVYMYKYY